MKKLKNYIKENKTSVTKIAAMMDVPHATVYSWITNKSKPGVINAVKLEKITDGKVSVIDWTK